MKNSTFTFFSLLFVVVGLSCKQKEQTIRPHPNILFILTDDQSKIDISAYGHEMLSTPNINQLISESMRFDLAFTNTAMCVPSRSSLFTGLYPLRHGAVANHAPISEGITGVATHLEKLGYKVGLIGKIHINPIEKFGFHYQKNLLDFAWDRKLTKAEMRLAMETLGADGQPFVLFVCIGNPHTPWPGEWDKNIDDIKLPPHLLDESKTRLTLSRYYAHVEVADQKVGETVEVAKELGLYDDMAVFFSSDHGAEFVHGKYTLYDAGINVPLSVKWPNYIEAATTSQAMVEFVDIVPTLIDLAGGESIDSLDGESFLPVLLNQTKEHQQEIYAVSYKDRMKTDYPILAVRTKKYKYLLNPEFEETYTSWVTDSTLGDKWPGYDRHYGYWLNWLEAAKTDEHAKELVDNYLHRPREELYDLENDPNELKNIINDPSLSRIKIELRAKLKKWVIEQNHPDYTESLFAKLPL